MELVTVNVTVPHKAHERVVIRPIGDIQWTGPKGKTALDTLRRDIDATLEQGGYFLGMGDYLDTFSPSNRARLKAADLYETATEVIDSKSVELAQELYELALKPTTGRWLGMLEGHHFSDLMDGSTTDMWLCNKLKARFLGTSALIRLQFLISGSRYNVVFWAHHGTGGGMKACAPLNKLENLSPYWGGVDVFLMAHTTKSPVVPINRIYPRWHGHDSPDLIHKKVYFVSCGGYSKAWVRGNKQGQVLRGDYAEKGMMNPSVLGAPLIVVNTQHTYNRKDGVEHRQWTPEIKVEV